jgi:UDP-N-acetylglucosamine 2-epimerase (non-hydrolysing)
MLKVLCVVGARPNFMKVAPIIAAMRQRAELFAPVLVHTGQHYDAQMSDAFFRDLNLPAPDVHLGVGSGSHAAQTAKVMLAFEPVLEREKPDWVLVVGDVNSTLACALVATKMLIRVAHVEAGLRSRDRAMPEEINRILTDQISDLLLTPSPDADRNLLQEGIALEKIRLVGNVMIDSLFAQLERASASKIRARLGIEAKNYAVVTLHRPSNVDERETFANILAALEEISERIEIIFPIHPRARRKIEEFNLQTNLARHPRLRLIEPLGYLDFLRLMSGARLVLTDSGGLQEETTALGIPCLTLRENTERPVTVEMGTNQVVGTRRENILRAARAILDAQDAAGDETRNATSNGRHNAAGSAPARARIPPLWDGHAAERILDALIEATRGER